MYATVGIGIMKVSIGIVGLPNVGKSTLFKLLTGRKVHIANYPFATVDPNVGVVPVPDERLKKLVDLLKVENITPAVVEFYDIAGLVKGANKGEGLGNQFLSHIRNVAVIVEVVRCFRDDSVAHIESGIDPIRDMDIVDLELRLKDEESAEKENLLSKKPKIILLNGSDQDVLKDVKEHIRSINTPFIVADLAKVDGVEQLIKEAFQRLNLINFFTINPTEVRAWPIKRGTKAPQAAGVIHSDFERSFIKAEAIHWKELMNAGGWSQARKTGKIRLEGKEYIVEDGDVLFIRHG